MSIEIGLSDNQRKDIASGLAGVLANTHALYMKTQGYHWNVTGPQFVALHGLFEEQYTDLAGALDVVAERIRSLGVMAPVGVQAMTKLATLPEDDGASKSDAMVANLVKDNEAMARQLRELAGEAADAGDEATADLLIARLDTHEKAAWMLRSLLS